jgi:cytochrome c oxidase assembly protein subunit 15
MVQCLRQGPGTTHARRSVVLFALITLQAALGITALVTQVQLHAALAHQGGALVVLGFAVAHWRGFLGAYPPEVLVVERD